MKSKSNHTVASLDLAGMGYLTDRHMILFTFLASLLEIPSLRRLKSQKVLPLTDLNDIQLRTLCQTIASVLVCIFVGD